RQSTSGQCFSTQARTVASRLRIELTLKVPTFICFNITASGYPRATEGTYTRGRILGRVGRPCPTERCGGPETVIPTKRLKVTRVHLAGAPRLCGRHFPCFSLPLG